MSGRLPNGACDSHCHIFGPAARFPFDVDRTYTPNDAPKEALFALHRHLGIDRGVIVQPACHGFDHSAMLDALAAGGGRYRGVALLPEAAGAEEVAALHACGVRGVRFNFMPHLAPPPSREGFRRIAAMIAPHDWHVVFHLTPASIDTVRDYMDGLALPFVIDHMARISVSDGAGQANFESLMKVAKDERAWIKIAAADRISEAGAPYTDVESLMRFLIMTAPQRILWGTDWPHPNVRGAVPDDDVLLNLLLRVTDQDTLHEILVRNPARLYQFG